MVNWAGHEGTPETLTRIAAVPSRRRQSPLVRMFELGKISLDELQAAERIITVMEMIGSASAIRSSSLDARVDCSGSAKDVLVETLGRVRAEATYSQWRKSLPKPEAMILHMLSSNQSYVAVARSYGIPYRTARKKLLTAIRLWMTLTIETRKRIDKNAVEASHSALGGGVVSPPAQGPSSLSLPSKSNI